MLVSYSALGIPSVLFHSLFKIRTLQAFLLALKQPAVTIINHYPRIRASNFSKTSDAEPCAKPSDPVCSGLNYILMKNSEGTRNNFEIF